MKKVHPQFKAKVVKGAIKFINQAQFLTYIATFKDETILDVIVKKHYKKRSERQNAYYWVCMTIIGNEIGEEPEDMHATFKSMFLTKNKEVRGNKIRIIPSTTKLSTMQFSDYFDKVQRFVGTELGITLPSPEDYYSDSYPQEQ